MRRIILSIAAAAVVVTGLAGATPAKADWWPYYGYNNWRAHQWREHQYWAWRRHLWWEWHDHQAGYWHPGGYWYR